METNLTLVIGGTGKTGRRVVARLTERGLPVRIGSRSGSPRFDWDEPATWEPAVRGAAAVYITFSPDVTVPGALEKIGEFSRLAVAAGVRRLVMLSGRGEPAALECEQVVRDAGAEWTIVRSAWFAQNFSEDYLLDPVLAGHVALPAGDVPEPFVDVDDVADVAAAALTEDGHGGKVYEVSGPRALTFAEAVAEIAKASGREIPYTQVSVEEYAAELKRYEVPADAIEALTYIFGTVLDGRNAQPVGGVRAALGRDARDFATYARNAAATGVWNP